MKTWVPGRRSTTTAVVLSLVLWTMNTGCKDAFQKDVTNDPQYGNFFGVVGKWKAKAPLELEDIDKQLFLAPKNDRYHPGGRLILTLPVGTEIRIEHLIYHEEAMGGSPLYVMGSLVSGAYSEKPIQLSIWFFRPNPFTHRGVSTPPPDWTSKWTVSSDVLTK